jgi:acyl carrier protein
MTTPATTVPEGLKQVFAKVLRVPADEIGAQSSTKTTRNWDSLRHVELVVAIEEKYGISFSASEVFALTSVQGFVDMLARKNVVLMEAAS